MERNLNNIIVAHRGESYLAPENTLAAINLAWKNGVKAVEIDVQLTLDHQIVVIHDKTTKRVGNINKSIRQSWLKELKEIDVGLSKSKSWEGEQIPSLMEVFQTIPADCKLIIEIKSGIEIIEPLCTLIKSLNPTETQIEMISFNRILLTKLKKQLPRYKMLWLLNLDYHIPACLLFNNTHKTINKVLNAKLDGVNVWAGRKINKNFITDFKKNHLLVYTWTVNDVKMAHKMLELEVDAITTDRPSWLIKQLLNDNQG